MMACACVAFLMIGCGQTSTSPGCYDPFNRTAPGPDSVDVSCLPVGSDLRCTATGVSAFLYTCPRVTLDVTSTTLWASSDPSIAFFTQPAGYLKVQAPGVVQVSQQYNGLPAFPARLAFTVAPGVPPERMLQLDVIVWESSRSNQLSGVQVDIVPDRGPRLACQTGQFGGCADTNLFVLPGMALFRLTKSGYPTTELTFTSPTDSFFWGPDLRMQVGH